MGLAGLLIIAGILLWLFVNPAIIGIVVLIVGVVLLLVRGPVFGSHTGGGRGWY